MISLRVEALGKAYQLYKKPIDSLKELLLRRTCHETFWALREVNFELPAGAALGVVGDNGAGKTTLLQLLAGTITPTCGKVERHGRVSALLELGAGFHHELSGLENIRIGCAVLGLSSAETAQRLPEIIAFSELEKFIDRPVKTYSSGMFLRLAFAIATVVEPDILVVDEHLSVGDQHFQKKCLDRMAAYLEQGRTLIFCSHSLYHINHICDQCLWLRNGRPEMLGPSQKVTECYQDYVRSREAKNASTSAQNDETLVKGETCLREVSLGGDCRDGVIEMGGTFIVRVAARLSPAAQAEGAHVGVMIFRNDRICCYGTTTQHDNVSLHQMAGDEYGVSFVVENLPLLSGEYCLDVALLDGNGMHIYDFWKAAASFKVRQSTREFGVSRLLHHWELP